MPMQDAGMQVVEVSAGHTAKGTQLHTLVGEAMQSCSLAMQDVHQVRPA